MAPKKTERSGREGTPDAAAGTRLQLTVAFANEHDLERFKELARRKRLGPSVLARMVLAEYIDNAQDAAQESRR